MVKTLVIDLITSQPSVLFWVRSECSAEVDASDRFANRRGQVMPGSRLLQVRGEVQMI